MAGLTLPEAQSAALLETRAGLLFRLVARAAREDDWSAWAQHLALERALGAPEGLDESSLLAVLGGSADGEARAALSLELGQGLGAYLVALSPRERVRSAGRVTKLLHAVGENTPLSPFGGLERTPEEDQRSIWEAVLRVLLSQAAGDGLDQRWLAHLAHLPDELEPSWREQLDGLSLDPGARQQIELALAPAPVRVPAPVSDEFPPIRPPGEPVSVTQASDVPVEPVAVEGVEVVDVEVATIDVPVAEVPPSVLEAAVGHDLDEALDEALERALSGQRPAVTAESVALVAAPTMSAEEALADLDVDTVPDGQPTVDEAVVEAGLEAPGESDQASAGDDVVVELEDGEDVVVELEADDDVVVELEAGADAASGEVDADEGGSTPGRLELTGGYAGKPLPRVLRVLGVLTGLIVLVALARVLARFVLGWRRDAKLWLEDGHVYVESSSHLLGREMRRERRSFGPRGLLSVSREVRYPYLYTFLGLFALCAGTLVGTIVFLDGRMAGFEDWMRVGLYLILGALVVDFLFTVIAATRPGRTSLILTFEPRTTFRVLGVSEADADQMLDALVKSAHP